MIPAWVAIALSAFLAVASWYGRGLKTYVDFALQLRSLEDARSRTDSEVDRLRDKLEETQKELAEQRGASRGKSN